MRELVHRHCAAAQVAIILIARALLFALTLQNIIMANLDHASSDMSARVSGQ
ncbi:hypothetical protein N5J77_29940 [Sphingobium yanoikuyae]|uniref:Uncharacterized protein n=1 Tax=Sphingobium yanoikuyae TaxID=13690 RepID=A0AA43BDD8_SPHYA|nr:hypothetical protein [Sphingobium yanoikuyae]MDH2135343.1 hypothetical protein [Sphingobium yanoikuyae]